MTDSTPISVFERIQAAYNNALAEAEKSGEPMGKTLRIGVTTPEEFTLIQYWAYRKLPKPKRWVASGEVMLVGGERRIGEALKHVPQQTKALATCDKALHTLELCKTAETRTLRLNGSDHFFVFCIGVLSPSPNAEQRHLLNELLWPLGEVAHNRPSIIYNTALKKWGIEIDGIKPEYEDEMKSALTKAAEFCTFHHAPIRNLNEVVYSIAETGRGAKR